MHFFCVDSAEFSLRSRWRSGLVRFVRIQDHVIPSPQSGIAIPGSVGDHDPVLCGLAVRTHETGDCVVKKSTFFLLLVSLGASVPLGAWCLTHGIAHVPAGTPVGGVSVESVTDYGNEVYNVKSYGAKGDCTTDDSSAINSTIQAARSGHYSGAVLHLPKGCYATGSTVAMVNFEGLIFEGAGSGEAANASTTSLKWIGASGGTMLAAVGCIGCRIKDLVLDGGSSAGIGLQYTGNLKNGGLVSYNTQIEGVVASGIAGTPSIAPNLGTCFWVGDLNNTQVSESSLRNDVCELSSVGVYQTGVNTLNIRYDDMSMSGVSVQPWDIESGSFAAWNPVVASHPTAPDWTIKCKVASSTIISPYDENSGRAAVMSFPSPGSDMGCGVVTIIGGQIGTSQKNQKLIDYEQLGTFNIIGNKISSDTGGQIHIVATSSPSGYRQVLNFIGNKYSNVTLGGTTPGTVNGTNYSMQCFENGGPNWCPVMLIGDLSVAKVMGPSRLEHVTYSNLPVKPEGGVLLYCSDCKNIADDLAAPGAACETGGHGAVAKSEHSRWDCN